MKEKLRQSASVFVARTGSLAIVVTMHQNQDGIWYEDDTPSVLREPLTATELGQAVARAMQGTSKRPKNLGITKPSDWPAYRASGARSVRRFEDEFIHLTIDGANEANLVAVVTGSPEKDARLEVTGSVSLSTSPTALGDLVLRVFQACRDRRF